MTEEAATPEASPAPAAPAWAPEVETEARALGWKSSDEWKGELPPSYIDNPERYVERAYSSTPFRKAEERHNARLAEVESKADERLRKVEAAMAKTYERDRAALIAQIEQVKAEKVQAVEVGDVDRFRALEKREDALRKVEMPAPVSAPEYPADETRAVGEWISGKTWFNQDRIKTQAAVEFYAKAEAQGLRSPADKLKFVEMEMSKTFADLAPKPVMQAVDAGLTFGNTSQTLSFDKLPKEARDAYKRFVARGLADTKENRDAYAEDYNAA